MDPLIGLRRLRALVVFVAASATGAPAQVHTFFVRMDGAQQVPPATTAAAGLGHLVLDTNAHTLTFDLVYSGLVGTETAAHIHGFAMPGTNAPILHPLPVGSPKVGSITTSPVEEASILAGLAYVNVHSSVYLNGEIRGQMLLALPPIATYVCAGDGAGTPCPCGNSSPAGAQRGCLHSWDVGGSLRTEGFASIAQDSLVLVLSDLPPSTSVLCFQGTSASNGGLGAAFGDGLRCASGSVLRMGIVVTSGGAARLPAVGGNSLHVTGGIAAPGTRTYQAWFRNSAAFCTPSTFNLTNGATLTWES